MTANQLPLAHVDEIVRRVYDYTKERKPPFNYPTYSAAQIAQLVSTDERTVSASEVQNLWSTYRNRNNFVIVMSQKAETGESFALPISNRQKRILGLLPPRERYTPKPRVEKPTPQEPQWQLSDDDLVRLAEALMRYKKLRPALTELNITAGEREVESEIKLRFGKGWTKFFHEYGDRAHAYRAQHAPRAA